VHAGSAGDADRGGVLIAGASGSGKTTVALAALAAGMRYVSDDYVLLHGGPEPVAWNLYGTAKLDAGHLLRFPQFASAGVPNDPDEKAVLSVLEEAPGALVEQLPIRAIVVPRVRGGRAAVRASSAADALLALAPSTALQMPFDNGRALAVLADVARAVPCFALDVGDDPGDLAVALNRVLDGDVVGPTGRSAAH
jgi:hypothetical protein